MLSEGLIRMWEDRTGQQGLIPYSSRQAGVFKKLKETGRYDLAELKHIAECWGDYLEAVVVEEPPYDDRELSDLENFRRRVAENVSFFRDEVERGSGRDEIANQRLSEWQQTARILEGKAEHTISDPLRSIIQRHLWHLCWHDEFVRLIMAQQFEAKLLQGYSVQVTFNRTSWHAGETALSDINWESTFRRIRDMRQEGQLFPLRMPEFNVTENGIELLRPLTPEQYSDIYLRHNMPEMLRVLDQMGDEIWSPPPPPLGDSICRECAGHFDRQKPTQVYCGERCRKRAKNRRWREKDPERARQCQAKYWSSYGDIT